MDSGRYQQLDPPPLGIYVENPPYLCQGKMARKNLMLHFRVRRQDKDVHPCDRLVSVRAAPTSRFVPPCLEILKSNRRNQEKFLPSWHFASELCRAFIKATRSSP